MDWSAQSVRAISSRAARDAGRALNLILEELRHPQEVVLDRIVEIVKHEPDSSPGHLVRWFEVRIGTSDRAAQFLVLRSDVLEREL